MSEEATDGLSVKELKQLITGAGLSHADCITKEELRERARDAVNAKPPKTHVENTRETKVIAGYHCTLHGHPDVIAQRQAADFAVVVLHGLGASGSDFADLPNFFKQDQRLQSKRIIYVFPQAPPQMMGMPAWWQIDVMKFLTIHNMAPDDLAKLIREEPPGLSATRESLTQLLQEARQLASGGGPLLSSKKVLLGGFSQGAMTALDLALHQSAEETLAGVAFLSGAPIVVEQWAKRFEHHKKLPIFMSHGVADPTLPFVASGWVRELLQNHRMDFEFHEHSGGHNLGDDKVVRALTSFVSRVATT